MVKTFTLINGTLVEIEQLPSGRFAVYVTRSIFGPEKARVSDFDSRKRDFDTLERAISFALSLDRAI